MSREFVCQVCGDLCVTETSEADANREFLDSGISTDETTELISACDDCYELVMAKAREMGLLDE